MIISKRELEAIRNKSYLEGYAEGKRVGVLEGLVSVKTPNQIREAFGYPPMTETNENLISLGKPRKENEK